MAQLILLLLPVPRSIMMCLFLCDVDEVDHDKVFAFFRNGVESLVHFHTCWVPVMTKPDENNPVLLREDGLVHLPPIVEVLQHETHPEALFLLSLVEVNQAIK